MSSLQTPQPRTYQWCMPNERCQAGSGKIREVHRHGKRCELVEEREPLPPPQRMMYKNLYTCFMLTSTAAMKRGSVNIEGIK